MLSNVSIRKALECGDIRIDPLGEGAIQPSSIDVHLGELAYRRRALKHEVFGTGPRVVDPYSVIETNEAFYGPFKLHDSHVALIAGEFILVSTKEIVTIGPHHAAQIVGKSSLARHGLIVESAGFIDPGFSGSVTLELAVLAGGIKLFPGMPIAQIVFFRLDERATDLYSGSYGGTTGPQLPAFHKHKRPTD